MIDALKQIVDDYVDHGSWRCYSTRYPDECLCGLDTLLREAGLDPRYWQPWSGER